MSEESQWHVSPTTPSVAAARRLEADGIVAPPPQCPLCWDWQWVRVDVPVEHPLFGKLQRCKCATEQGRARHRTAIRDNCGLKRGEIDRSFRDWQLGEWAPKEAHRMKTQRRAAETAVKRALREGAGFVTLFGDHGAGKSLMLNIAVAEAVRSGKRAYFSEAPFILDHIRSMVGAKQDTSEFWQMLLTVPVLAIDEITRFHETGWAQERIFVLTNERYRLAQAGTHLTLWATNDDPNVALPPAQTLGYMYSRMREWPLYELRGDTRKAIGRGREIPF